MRRAAVLLTTFALVGCTNATPQTFSTPALKLVSFNSCDDLLPKIRAAAKESVGPWGFTAGGVDYFDGPIPPPMMSRAEGAVPDAAGKAAQDFSGTNTHTAGVDEPDLVKTDGKRIVIATSDSLHVIDAATRRETSRIPLERGASQLLLSGDKVLVLRSTSKMIAYDAPANSKISSPGWYQQGTHLQLFDIAGVPKVIGDYAVDGQFVDARQTGSTVRVVVKSMPTITFPIWREGSKDEQRIADNRTIIDSTPLDRWLPGYTVNGKSGRVGCADVSLPESFSGASLVTLLSFDLAGPTLSEGDPVALFADGETVYGSGPNLYLANDQRWLGWRTPTLRGKVAPQQQQDRTDLYQFDVTSAKPAYVAAGSVSGWLLSQYSLSEHEGVLRAATTNQPPWQTTAQGSSTVYSLRREGGSLREIGQVGGLGKGERIYAVRFVGPVGYVVTFRQTDPLYTLDLRDPAKPKVAGELKIAGYSAYLHPVAPGRLIGVGQDATDKGRVTGTQISLFDVTNLDSPSRLDQFKIPGGHSEAEHDPHAFLYWPATQLLVVPVNAEALLVRVDNGKITELGRVTHDVGRGGYIRRSLVIGDTLWTISDQGAMASTLDSGRRLAFLSL